MLAEHHQRAQPILAQHGRIGGKRLDHRAGPEEIGRVIAERDAVLQVDASEVKPGAIGRLPAQESLAQFVADVLVAGEGQVVGGAKVEASAVGERYPVAELPLVARSRETASPPNPPAPVVGTARRGWGAAQPPRTRPPGSCVARLVWPEWRGRVAVLLRRRRNQLEVLVLLGGKGWQARRHQQGDCKERCACLHAGARAKPLPLPLREGVGGRGASVNDGGCTRPSLQPPPARGGGDSVRSFRPQPRQIVPLEPSLRDVLEPQIAELPRS